MKSIELIVQNNETGKLYDISEVTSSIKWDTQMEEQPGKLTFVYQDQDGLVIHEGSPVSFLVNKKGLFFGYVFNRERKGSSNEYNITAYDQLYYFKNTDTYVFPSMTADQRLAKICKDKNLPYRVDIASSYMLPAAIEDGKTLYKMVQNGIDQTMVNTGDWYIIRDNFGTIQYTSVNSLKTLIFIGDESLVTDYSFKSSIDNDTYNQVKLIKENKDTKKREVYIVKDSNNIKKWGLLQYFEKMDEKANPAQIKARADMILKLKNRVVKSLTLPCLGDTRIFAGVGIVLGLSDLKKEGIPMNKYFIVTSCSHSFENDKHTMDLEVQVSI